MDGSISTYFTKLKITEADRQFFWTWPWPAALCTYPKLRKKWWNNRLHDYIILKCSDKTVTENNNKLFENHQKKIIEKFEFLTTICERNKEHGSALHSMWLGRSSKVRSAQKSNNWKSKILINITISCPSESKLLVHMVLKLAS